MPFYIAGGALATWAVIVSVGLGLRKSDFPGSLVGQRVVLAISGLFVAGAVSMALLTSGSPAKGFPAKALAAAPSRAPAASAVSLAANPGGLLSYNTKQLS